VQCRARVRDPGRQTNAAAVDDKEADRGYYSRTRMVALISKVLPPKSARC
jgi:hypothetical protein